MPVAKSNPYLGEGDIANDRIREAIRAGESAAAYGSSGLEPAKEDYNEVIRSALEAMSERMAWRGRFGFGKKQDPLEPILGSNVREFYRAFDDVRKERISINVAGSRKEHPFVLYIDESNFVAGMNDLEKQMLWYGYGLMETWRADPQVYFLDGKGVPAFQTLFCASLAYLLALYVGSGLSAAREVMRVFDPEGVLEKNLAQLASLTGKKVWPGREEIQRKAAIALRGYLNAWFDFMAKSSWLEIHHTLHDTKVLEREQSFLDTATTEISETARGIVPDEAISEVFGAEHMERRERERREKQMEWTMLRIALGILYPREKALIRSYWEKGRRSMTWKELEETYYEDIWDLMRLHLSGQDLEQKIMEKDKGGVGRWHFIFELKKSERPREKVKTLQKMSLVELCEKKNVLLSQLVWEGHGLPADATWDDAILRFRKIIIKYHPDRVEITGVDPGEAQRISTQAIQSFRELEIIHDLEPWIFGMESIPDEYLAKHKSQQ
jgi:hypothetical protein